MKWRTPRPAVRTVLGAIALTTIGTLPVFLLSSQSVFVREDLGFDETRFGIAVGTFFASAAAAALLGGGLIDRLGRRTGTVVAGSLAALGGLGVAVVASSWTVLMVFLVVLGVANAACQVTANLSLARTVPAHRRGLGFGIKQAAIPLAIVLAGLAVPTVSVLAGWRWTFALTGVGGLVVLLAGLLTTRADGGPTTRVEDPDHAPLPALLVSMAAITLASAAANSLGAFLASWGFQVGLTPSAAGLLMAAGSAANIGVRVLVGHLADLRYGRNLPVVALQMLAGAVSLALLSVPSPWVVVPAGLLAFGLGWSWPGLLLYAVVRLGRDAPAAASSIVQAGAFVGGASGPALFGVLVGVTGYPTAWWAAAGAFLGAALLVLLARSMFAADLQARPPREPFGYGGGRDAPARTTPPREAQKPPGG